MDHDTVVLQLRRMCAEDSQRNVASALGVSETLLSHVLAGRRKISADLAKRLGYRRKIILDKVGK